MSNSIDERKNITFEQSVQKLHQLFGSIHGRSEVPDEPYSIVPALTKEGCIQYQTYQLNDAPDELKEQVRVGRILMERFVGVASAAVNRKYKLQPDTMYAYPAWKDITTPIFNAFFTNPSSGKKSFSTEVEGINIAKSVIDFACTVIAGDVKQFADFLKGFGGGLSAEMRKTKASYNYLYSYSQHRLFKNVSGIVFYEATFDVAGTFFKQEQKKISTSCGSHERTTLDFSVDETAAVFKIEQYMNDNKFKAAVDNFLDRFEGKTITDTTSFFEGIFDDVKQIGDK